MSVEFYQALTPEPKSQNPSFILWQPTNNKEPITVHCVPLIKRAAINVNLCFGQTLLNLPLQLIFAPAFCSLFIALCGRQGKTITRRENSLKFDKLKCHQRICLCVQSEGGSNNGVGVDCNRAVSCFVAKTYQKPRIRVCHSKSLLFFFNGISIRNAGGICRLIVSRFYTLRVRSLFCGRQFIHSEAIAMKEEE